MTAEPHGPVAAVCDELRRGQQFLVTSHARPDGDSVGSQVALALALKRGDVPGAAPRAEDT